MHVERLLAARFRTRGEPLSRLKAAPTGKFPLKESNPPLISIATWTSMGQTIAGSIPHGRYQEIDPHADHQHGSCLVDFIPVFQPTHIGQFCR